MKKISLTPSQDKAVNFEGKNILVSAGAGSGKTQVLKERVIRKLKSGIRVDKLIILTFTNAAAYEMKDRILKAINEDESLSYQLKYLDNAIISTFDAFCLRLVKEYYYLLDLPSDIKIGDALLIKELKQTALDDILRKYYLEAKPEFVELVKVLFQKGDDLLVETIKGLAEKLITLPNYEEFIRSYETSFFTETTFKRFWNEYETKIREDLQDIYEDYLEFKNHINIETPEKVNVFLQEIEYLIDSLVNTESFDQLLLKLKNGNFPRKPVIKDEEIKAMLDDSIKHYKNRLVSIFNEVKELHIDSTEESLKAYLEPKTRVLTILEIIKEYVELLNSEKLEKNLYGFDDIMKFAIKLLEMHPEISDVYKNEINEIMIDEYQDTNDLQDYFISLLENNNIFMVGDIKQSIYGFRDANPDNFAKRYLDFKYNKTGEAIDLRENFRSRKEVINDINDIFMLIMDQKLGGINYQDDQGLIYGQKLYDSYRKNQNLGLNVITYDFKALKEEYDNLTKVEVEMTKIAKDIRDKIDNHFQVYDLGKKGFRDIMYEDISIIVDRKTNFMNYSEILCKYNIPVNIISDEPFKSSEEMLFLSQYLLLIKCFVSEEYFKKYFKKAFLSVARSFVYQISDVELIDFYVFEKIQTHEDLNKLRSYPKLNIIFDDINMILPLLETESNYEIIKKIYQVLNLPTKVAYLDNPKQKSDKLDYFILQVKDLPNQTFSDLILYLETLINDKDMDISYQHNDTSIKAITLLSMHKSKGLEYPICYYPGLYKRFKLDDSNSYFSFDKEYGIVSKVYNNGFYDSFMKKLLTSKKKRNSISEKIRLFYVALTRAKENIYILADKNDVKNTVIKNDENGYIKGNIRENTSSFLDLLRYDENFWDKSLNIDFARDKSLVENAYVPKNRSKVVKLKIENNAKKADEISYSKTNMTILDDETLDSIDYGTKVHEWISNIDFKSLDREILHLPEIVKNSILNLSKTLPFKNILESDYFSEYEFIDENGKTGIIDFLIFDKFVIYVIDFKLKNIQNKAYNEQLKSYKHYLSRHFDKPIKTYLYSIYNMELLEVND